jgi:hypothetical protein
MSGSCLFPIGILYPIMDLMIFNEIISKKNYNNEQFVLIERFIVLCRNYSDMRESYKKILCDFNDVETRVNEKVEGNNLKKMTSACNFSDILKGFSEEKYNKIIKRMLTRVLCEDGIVEGVSAGPVPTLESFSLEQMIEKYFLVSKNLLDMIDDSIDRDY